VPTEARRISGVSRVFAFRKVGSFCAARAKAFMGNSTASDVVSAADFLRQYNLM